MFPLKVCDVLPPEILWAPMPSTQNAVPSVWVFWTLPSLMYADTYKFFKSRFLTWIWNFNNFMTEFLIFSHYIIFARFLIEPNNDISSYSEKYLKWLLKLTIYRILVALFNHIFKLISTGLAISFHGKHLLLPTILFWIIKTTF